MTILRRFSIPLVLALALMLALPSMTAEAAANRGHHRGAATVATATVEGVVTLDRISPFCSPGISCTAPAVGVAVRFAPPTGLPLLAVTDATGAYRLPVQASVTYTTSVSDSLGTMKVLLGPSQIVAFHPGAIVLANFLVASRIV